MLTGKERMILSALEGLAQENEVEIVTIEIIGSKKAPIIRVYIDTEGGVSFNELSSAQAWIGQKLDEIDPFPGAYTLEVSSPGMERPLRTEEHFQRFAGQEVRVRTVSPLNGSSSFSGVLQGVEEGTVRLETDAGEVAIPLDQIKRANLIARFDF